VVGSAVSVGSAVNAGGKVVSAVGVAGDTVSTIIANNSGGSGKFKAGDKTDDGHIMTDHAAQRANERGFNGEKIDSVINNYSPKVYQSGGQSVYAKKNGNWYDVVITNREGNVVSVVGGQSNSLKNWKDVERMLNNKGGYSTIPLD
jgi:hypothetical protein